MDVNCINKSTPHLHCPFCVKTDYYQDPVILKAHYRVKHVDKGAEWAGILYQQFISIFLHFRTLDNN